MNAARCAPALLLALVALASAGTPGEYAYRWPVSADPAAGAHRVTLTPAVYAQLSSGALQDLEVFNGAGESVPFGPVPSPTASVRDIAPARTSVPWFALPATTAAPGSDGSVHLYVERDADGRVRRLEADVPGNAGTQAARSNVLVDLSALARPVDALELEWEDTAGGVSARFRVLAGDELDEWHGALAEVGVMDLRQNGFQLVRRRIELPQPLSHAFVLLERVDDGEPLALRAVHAIVFPGTHSAPAAPDWAEAGLVARGEKPQAFEYRAPGPLPAEAITLELASPNSVSNVQVLSRDRDDGYWRVRAAFTAFRVGARGSETTHEMHEVDGGRDRQWRIVAEPPLDQAPALRIAYHADAFALVPRGQPPFMLAAGSASAQRPDYPMAALLQALRVQGGPGWDLVDAGLGAREPLRGAAAFATPPKPFPTRQFVLWAVLLAGAALVAVLVLRLLRTAPDDPQRGG